MNEIVKAATFEERVYERIRTDIGSLMSDDELKKLVETAIERMFFKERIIRNGYNDIKLPPLIQEITQKAVETQVTAHVGRYIAEHEGELKSIIDSTLKRGFLNIAAATFEQLIAPGMNNLRADLFNVIATLQKHNLT